MMSYYLMFVLLFVLRDVDKYLPLDCMVNYVQENFHK